MIQKTFYYLCCALMSLSMGFAPLAWSADPAPAKPAAKSKEPPKAVERPTRTFGEEPMFYFDADRRPSPSRFTKARRKTITCAAAFWASGTGNCWSKS